MALRIDRPNGHAALVCTSRVSLDGPFGGCVDDWYAGVGGYRATLYVTQFGWTTTTEAAFAVRDATLFVQIDIAMRDGSGDPLVRPLVIRRSPPDVRFEVRGTGAQQTTEIWNETSGRFTAFAAGDHVVAVAMVRRGARFREARRSITCGNGLGSIRITAGAHVPVWIWPIRGSLDPRRSWYVVRLGIADDPDEYWIMAPIRTPSSARPVRDGLRPR